MADVWLVQIDLVVGFSDPNDDMRSFVTDAYAELAELDGLRDPNVTASVAERQVSFSMIVEGDRSEALATAGTSVRTALHAAGSSTAGWHELIAESMSRSRTTVEPAAGSTPERV